MPVERIALAGFSQGACLIAELLSREPRPYAAAAILTGGLFGTEDQIHAPTGSLHGMHVLVTGHVDDSWVPGAARASARRSCCGRRTRRWSSQIHDDPEHQINDDEVAAVRRLLVGVGA